VKVTIPGDHPTLRPREKDVSGQIFSWNVSPTGKRLLLGARGDIWSIPAEHGPTINHTRSDGVADRMPEWSPDGQWIAWLSDRSGEYEIWVQQSDGKQEARQVGSFGAPYRYGISWSPDSKTIAYEDKAGVLYLVDLESARRTKVFSDYWGNPNSISWSHDSRWLAHTGGLPNQMTGIYLYDVENGEDHQVTQGMFNDRSPAFDRKGDFLYYVSERDFTNPTYEDVGTTFIYDDTGVVLMVPLRTDVEVPGGPKEDLETWKSDDEKSADDGADVDEDEDKDDDDSEAEEAEEEPLKIDLDGFDARAVALGIEHGRIGNLSVNDEGALLYVRYGDAGMVQIFDPAADEPEEKTVVAGFSSYSLSADGKKLGLRQRSAFDIVDAKADQKFEGKISTDELKVTIDPRTEWHEIFVDAWRLMRDFFYDPHMHGVDWKGVRKQYEAMLEDCSSRNDVLFVIREMISELNVGHAYNFGGDLESGQSADVGLLGVDFALDHGAYRIGHIYHGASWDSDARSVFDRAGVKVDEGDYVLAVNGVPIDSRQSVYAAFVGTAKETTRLTVGPNPKIDDESREVLVEPLSSEYQLRYRAWVEAARAYVDEKTDGRVGYIYVPDTGRFGQNELFRQFYGQRMRDALIIDERWNGGGQIPTRFIELLNRPVTNYWAIRDGKQKVIAWPPDGHAGPMCMLINGLAGSGGDAFPAYFREAGLGPLIGERTWGGLIGISGGPPLLDGAFLSEPAFAYFAKDGTWSIEGHGVDPDIEVVADPAALARGEDPQLDRGIAEMLSALKAHPPKLPPVPPYPDRSGMGIPASDH
jgi:tricorn protease